VKHRNKQAAMHIVIDLLAYGHWNEADKWLTERYIQHNPAFPSGRQTVVTAFSKTAPRPIPADPKQWSTKIVAVLAEKDLVVVANRVERPDPRNPGQTYTTTHFDMWRFVDGKADEHWDEGSIQAPGGGKGGGKAPEGKGK
jgi:predicted SnoaL-like aldol condensation-catalyzing enzyme